MIQHDCQAKHRFFTSIATFIDYDPVDGVEEFTDIFSNAVRLGDLAPLSRLVELKAGGLDLGHLPGFLHECAHHVTYDSAVGLALGALWASCQSTWTLQVGKSHPSLPARDLAVFDTAFGLLEPLIEGLALFAEHDLVSGNSPLVTRISSHAFPLFSKGRLRDAVGGVANSADVATTLWAGHSAVLRQARTDEKWVERKMHLLRQPMTGSHRYLLGYLAIKGIYHTLARANPGLRDPELFLLLIRDHLFGDVEFARKLLRLSPLQTNSDTDPDAAYVDVGCDVIAVLEHFQNQIGALFTRTNEIALKALEPLCDSTGARPLSRDSEVPTSARLPDDLDVPMGIRTAGLLNIAWPQLLKYRGDFRFSFERVEIEVGDSSTVVVWGGDMRRELLRTQAVNGATPGRYIGSIEAIRLQDLIHTVVCLLDPHGLVAVMDCQSGEWNDPGLVEYLETIPSAISIEGSMNAFSDRQKVIREHDGISQMLAAYKTQVADGVNLIYPQLIRHRWTLERRQEMMKAIEGSGLASIFPEEGDLRRVAQISLLAGTGAPADDVAAACNAEIGALRVEIDNLNARATGAGWFALFEVVENNVISRI